MKTRMFIIIVLVASLVLSHALALPAVVNSQLEEDTTLTGNIYYVSTDGDNDDDGLTEDTAWRTITFACTRLQAGDTLIIKSGDYGNEQAEITNSGTLEAPILIRAEIPGEVLLTGEGEGTGIYIQDKSHIIIEGIRLGNYSTGINVKYRSSYVTVRKCIFVENNNFGLLLYGWKDDPAQSHHHVFTENEFYDYTDKQDYGIALYFSTNAKATNNYFFGWHHQALSFKKLMFDSVAANNIFEGFRYTAIYLGQNEDSAEEGILRSHNLIAEGNTFRPALGYRAKRSVMVANVTRGIVRNNFMEGDPDTDGGWGEGIGISSSSINAKIYHNVIRGISGTTSNPGIRMYEDAVGTMVFNNTIVDCAYGLGFEVYASVLFKNNIFYNNGGMIRGSDAADARNCTFTYNNIYPDWEGKGPTDISADPLLVGPFTPLELESEDPKFIPDFSRAEVCQLQADSPCIDAGTHLVHTVGSGTGTEIVVQDAEYFTDGFDIAEGDAIRIGTNSLVRILEVDYDHNIITVDRSISWGDGDGVGLYYYSSAPDIGAYEFVPTLTLHGAPADQAIHLAWTVNTTLPVTSTWRLAYDGPTGDQPSPIADIISPTRAYTLTGLTNYVWYTVTLNAMLNSTPFLTDTVTVMPTDIFVYLPLVLR